MAVLNLFAPFAAVVIILHLTIHASIATVDSELNVDNQFEWQILSAKNFSHQIRLHPHILLIVTEPWCGESRSLMRDISQGLAKKAQQYDSLKLMIIHRNRDRVLADSLDASEGITVLCYWHAVPYNYLGSLRAKDILSSIHYLISLAPEDLPFVRLGDAKDLKTFLTSTDKAVLLLESCGWTTILMAQQTGNITVQGGLNKETNRTLASRRQKTLKGMTNEVNCEVEDGCVGSPWVGEFSAENATASSTNEDEQPTFGMSCSFEEYKRFESFFPKFVAAARAIYLPPQRQRYGIISERLLLSPLGVDVSDGWALIISYAGCPGCLKILKAEDHLQEALEIDDVPVMELEDKRNDHGPALPVDKPSILLFVDRMSDSSDTRRTSQEALHAFKEVAMQHWKPCQADGQNSGCSKRSSLHKYQKPAIMVGNDRSLFSSLPQKKDKMSIMILNDGKYVTFNNEVLNLQSGSLHEVLTYLLKKKKPLKLSSLVKEAGFQLLSNDVDIKIEDMISSQDESQDQESEARSVQDSDKDLADMNQDESGKILAMAEREEHTQAVNSEGAYNGEEKRASKDLASKESAFVGSRQSPNVHEVASTVDLDSKVHAYVLADKSEGLSHPFSSFTGSFFFSDGNHGFLKRVTNDWEIPTIVLIDPISQQHYVFAEGAIFTVSSISSFLDGFLNGMLVPYQRSGPLHNSVERTRPPFVNLDFHEQDSIPSVTTKTFSELVLGSNQSDAQNATNAWHEDVLLLLSSSWCGFCQRMELVVREVYRAIKGYMNTTKYEATSKEWLSHDDLKDLITKLPVVYSIDCTLNECGWILNSVGQTEVYPTLLLFPAKKKTAIPYNGNVMVTDIIKFIANHGSISNHLAKQKGDIWIDGEEMANQDNRKYEFMNGGSKESTDEQNVESLVKNGKFKNEVILELNEPAGPQGLPVGSFLSAMNDISPFSKARVLIVSADQNMGFQGLILNKPISWDFVLEFENVELLKDVPLFWGGPVVHEGMPLVCLTKSSMNGQYPQVLPGVYFIDQLATVNEIELVKAGIRSAMDYWFFWGYSGWTWDQLFNEMATGVWSLQDGNMVDLQWP